LEQLDAEKEKEVEEFLEIWAEDKFSQQQDIKRKFQQQTNMIQKAKKDDPNKAEKLQTIEDKKQKELKEMLEELNNKKKEKLAAIKEKYNSMATEFNIDSLALQQLLRN